MCVVGGWLDIILKWPQGDPVLSGLLVRTLHARLPLQRAEHGRKDGFCDQGERVLIGHSLLQDS